METTAGDHSSRSVQGMLRLLAAVLWGKVCSMILSRHAYVQDRLLLQVTLDMHKALEGRQKRLLR